MQIVIPMSGFGERFRSKGYELPKPLIEVNGKPIISYVIDMFPKESNFIFICNKEHLKDSKFSMSKILKKYSPEGRIVSILPHKKGPVHAVRQVKKFLNLDKPIIINYCDFTCYWNWQNFKNFVNKNECVGVIPAYKGFHPHSLGETNYAYLLEKKGYALDIQEKKPFTKNRMQEYASSGTYYFSSAKIMFEAFDYIKENNISVNNEEYVSLAYKYFFYKKNKKKILIYPLQHFMQWGTPADLEEYIFWSELFIKLNKNKEINNYHNSAVIIPMAGEGSRFIKEGYKKIKPLISVSGKEMILQAVNDLPNFEEKIFVLRSDMQGYEEIYKKLKEFYPKCHIKTIDALSEGQAVTSFEGIKKLESKIPFYNQHLTISACDNGVLYNQKKLMKLLNNPKVDLIVWGFRGYINAIRNPNMYGWLDLENNTNKIISASVKSSLNNLKTDPIIIGTFTFRNLEIAKDSITNLIKKNNRINNEFYVDSCINEAIELGFNCHLFEIDHYISWGTPNDLKTFEYWQSCFHKWNYHPYVMENDKRIPKEKLESLKQNTERFNF